MELRENGFWARLYRWSRRTVVNFVDFRGDPRLYNTDLCTMVRTIFIWCPLALAANVAVIGFVLYAAGQLFWMLWVYLGFLKSLAIVGLILGAAIACIYGVVTFGIWSLREIRHNDTAKLAAAYIRSKKASICPLISIKENPNEAA